MGVQLQFMRPVLDQHQIGWRDIAKTFAEAINCGSLSGERIPPTNCNVSVNPLVVGDSSIYLAFNDAVCDLQSTNVLVNLCEWGHAHISELTDVVVNWDRELVHFAEDVFPRRWPWLSFDLRECALVGQQVAIDIEFFDPQPKNVRDSINRHIGCWFKAANWGGYATGPFSPPQSTVVISSTPMLTEPRSICWYLDEYRCSDAVFDGLVNCLERVHATHARIERVRVGE